MAFRHPAIGHILADGDDAGRGGWRAAVLKPLGPDDAPATIRASDAKFLAIRPAAFGAACDRLAEGLPVRIVHGRKESLQREFLDGLRPAENVGDLRRWPDRTGHDVEGDGAHVGD